MNYTTAWQDEILMQRVENESAELVVRAEKTDAELVRLVLAGDETAFQQIFERYKRLVAFTAARYFKRPEQIEEVIQISFAKMFVELSNFQGKNDFSLASWLGKITTNVCLDELRKQKHKPENLLSELSEAESERLFAKIQNEAKTAENSLIERDLAEKLLSNIETEDRAILQMIHVEELSVGEVSEITGWSKSKIKIRAFRARNTLRKILRRFL